MSDRGESLQVRSIQYGAVGIALSLLFILAQTLTSASERLHADRAVAEFQEGQFAENRGDCKTAIAHYRTGLELADDPSYRLALARCLLKEGRTSEGDTYLSQVLAGDPTSGEANLLRAGLLAEASSIDEAALYYLRATTGSWPMGDTQGRYRARSDLAEMLYREQRWRELLPQLMQLRETAGMDETRLTGIARMFLDAGAPGEARDILMKLARSADVLALQGRAYLELRQPQQGAAALQEAARLTPGDGVIASDAAWAQAIVALESPEQGRREVAIGRVALERLKRCAAFEDRFATEAAATLDRAERRPATVERTRLRELIATLWDRAGASCGAEGFDERAVEYLMPDVKPTAEASGQ